MQPDEDNLFRDHLLDQFTTWYFLALVAMDLAKDYLGTKAEAEAGAEAETDEDTRP